jgi:hypothetical protein
MTMTAHRTARILTLASMSLVLLHAPVLGQSLGAVARAEEARRKTVPAAKVYTNDNLPVIEAAPEAPAAAAAEAGAVAQATAEAPVQPDAGVAADAADAPSAKGATAPSGKKDEAYWRKRIQTERDALARADSFALALQSRINALSTDFANRDDPAQRNMIAGDRQKALNELDRVRKEIVDRNKAISAIQQEARRENVPAGWVR